jgi:seryl-tRNA synthetase
MQEEEKAAEKAVTDALLKLGNLVHDSVRIDDNEVRQHELVAVSYTSSTACQRL